MKMDDKVKDALWEFGMILFSIAIWLGLVISFVYFSTK